MLESSRGTGGLWTLHYATRFKDAVPILLRLMLGLAFFAEHGMMKMRSMVAGGDWDFGAKFAEQMNAYAAESLLHVAAFVEFFGGLAILLGLFTRWTCLGICCVMAYAIFKVHWDAGFGGPDGYEHPLAMGLLALTLLILGPGSFSLDRVFFGQKPKEAPMATS